MVIIILERNPLKISLVSVMCFDSQNNISRNKEYVFMPYRFITFIWSYIVVKYFKCAFTVFIVVCIRMDLTEKEEEDPYAHSLIFKEIPTKLPVYLCNMLSPVSNI